MLLLTIALQAITLLEFVIRRELKKNTETLAGLVPGNPKMKIARPTAERILAQFKEINSMTRGRDTRVSTGRRSEHLRGGMKISDGRKNERKVSKKRKDLFSFFSCRGRYS